MSDFLQRLFSFVCGQDLSHTWAPGGVPLPFCERCTGLYVGAVIAVLLLRFRPAVDGRFRWIHAGLLVLMAPFGFQMVPQGPILRTMSGLWFAFGIVGLLRLGAGGNLASCSRARGTTRYLLWGLGSLVILPVFALRGGALASLVLPVAGFAGLLVFASLIAANAWTLLRKIGSLRPGTGEQVPNLP